MRSLPERAQHERSRSDARNGSGRSAAAATTSADAADRTTMGDGDNCGTLPPPTILEVDMPAKVALAGPVPLRHHDRDCGSCTCTPRA